ncbi:MFS transporter (plasmid) [Kitasatospora sp. NBC_00070]|uniref:MFS transporter n=1 Tax=Kitasatospora sp. NBC_00070 TaxID=2975962 RepID=UPI002F90B8DD
MARKWWTLLTVSVATFMLLIDITAVNVAVPAIRADLNTDFHGIQWVFDAYTLTLAAFVLTAGSIADRIGRRRTLVVGLAVFTFASLVCALAMSTLMLNLARAVQGVGAAVMFAVSLAFVALEFPAGRERGTAMGIFGATVGAAVAIGPLVGGALTHWFGWEAVFYVNVPIGVATIAVTRLKLAESRDPVAARIDVPGVATFSAALFLLVLALIRGNEQGWTSAPILLLLAASAVAMTAFVVIERRVGDPMLPLELFRSPAFTGVQLAAAALSGSIFALYPYITLYLQNYLGLSPFEAGVRYLPTTFLNFAVAPLAGILLSRLHARFMLCAGLTAVGTGLVLMAGITADDPWTTLLPGFVVAGVGVGLLNPVIADVAVSVVPTERSGMAAGVNDTFRQVGIAIGIAVWGAVTIRQGTDHVRQAAAGTPLSGDTTARQLVEAASSGSLDTVLPHLPDALRQSAADAARQGFLTGLNTVLLAGALVSFFGAALALWLVREHDIERLRRPS